MVDLVPDTLLLTAGDGDRLEVPVRVSGRARRLSLRIDPARGGAELVLPEGVDVRQAERFALGHLGWLRARLDRLPARVAFTDGVEVPVLGRPHIIRHRPDQRRGVWIVETADGDRELHVSGAVEFLPRRVADHLKTEARRTLASRARVRATELDRRPGRISVRDTRSRWGSCSSRGDLSFSWRLILAPEPVLDYVVAHEVAHLVEMSHSPRFWRLVERLMPDYERHRHWLKRHGGALHGYG